MLPALLELLWVVFWVAQLQPWLEPGFRAMGEHKAEIGMVMKELGF